MQEVMAPTKRWTTLRYHEVQHRLWFDDVKYKVVAAGARSGKTELAKRRLVRALIETKPWADSRYFFGGPTYQQAKRIAWKDFKALIPKKWVKKVSESSLYIETVFGSELWVVGMDEPQRIEGTPWDGCVLDECADQKPGVFESVVLPALSERDGWCWRVGRPKLEGPGARDFQQAFNLEDPDTKSYTWPSSDILPPNVIATAKRILDKITYQQHFDAKFGRPTRVPYQAFSNGNVGDCKYNPTKPILVGSDFNVDPMCWCLAHLYTDPFRLEVFDEIHVRNTTTGECAGIIADRYKTHTKGFKFYGDATGRSRKTATTDTDYTVLLNNRALRQLGRSLHYPRSNPSVKSRIDAVNTLLSNSDGDRRITIDPRCVHLIESLEGTRWKKGSFDLEKTNDEKDVTHMGDALGYLVHRLYPQYLMEFDQDEIEGLSLVAIHGNR